jgi:hypothetical protein
VAGILAKGNPAPVVKVIDLPDLPAGGDVADWIKAHGDAAEPDGMRAEVEAPAAVVEPSAGGPARADVRVLAAAVRPRTAWRHPGVARPGVPGPVVLQPVVRRVGE